MPNQDLITNTHKALNMVQHSQKKKKCGVLLSLVMQKVFDSMKISFLKSTLYNMGFLSKFLNTISVIYKKPYQSYIRNHKHN